MLEVLGYAALVDPRRSGELLEIEGFQVADYLGSFRREQFGCGSKQQVVRALAAGRRFGRDPCLDDPEE